MIETDNKQISPNDPRPKRKILDFLFLGAFIIFIFGREFYQESYSFNLPAGSVGQYQDMSSSKMISFPPKGKFALIVWSTTCPPCRLEMKRLKSSIENKNIEADKIFALNPYENRKIIQKFLKKNPFPFQFINVPGLVQQLDVTGTPTVAWFEGEKLVYKKTGVSLTGVFRLENFLNN